MKTSYVEIVNGLNQLWGVCYEVNIKMALGETMNR